MLNSETIFEAVKQCKELFDDYTSYKQKLKNYFEIESKDEADAYYADIAEVFKDMKVDIEQKIDSWKTLQMTKEFHEKELELLEGKLDLDITIINIFDLEDNKFTEDEIEQAEDMTDHHKGLVKEMQICKSTTSNTHIS